MLLFYFIDSIFVDVWQPDNPTARFTKPASHLIYFASPPILRWWWRDVEIIIIDRESCHGPPSRLAAVVSDRHPRKTLREENNWRHRRCIFQIFSIALMPSWNNRSANRVSRKQAIHKRYNSLSLPSSSYLTGLCLFVFLYLNATRSGSKNNSWTQCRARIVLIGYDAIRVDMQRHA